ncbi:MAG: GNAT family N-acetyltransferase [Gammaproteobacteria bacterium]
MKTVHLFFRSAEADDALAVARVHVRSWQTGYRGLLPDVYLDGLRPEERYSFGKLGPNQPATMVALMNGAICGFATTAPARDPEASGNGELCALYVDPEWWGRGIGGVLVAAARARLAEQRFREAVLWMLSGNARAQRFYGNNGWLADGLERKVEVWGLKVQEIRFRRTLP